MTKAEAIRRYLATNPGSSTPQVLAAVGGSKSGVSSTLSALKANGYVTAVTIGNTLSNRPRFAWSLADSRAKHTNARPPAKQSNGSLDSLIESMAQGLVAALVGRVQELLPSAMAHVAPAAHLAAPAALPALIQAQRQPVVVPAVTKAPAATIKARVGVIGLLPQQAGAIVAQMGEQLDLVFWNDGDDKGKLKAMADNCEVVFLHTRHCGHHTDQLVKGYGANLRRVTGGTSNLLVSMKAYFEETQA